MEFVVGEEIDNCTFCEPLTPSGIPDPAGLCGAHCCPSCGHWPHDAEDGCPVPDPNTGWCECEINSIT